MPETENRLTDFLRRIQRLAAPGLVLSRAVGPPLLLAAAREAVPGLPPVVIDSGGRKALVKSMETAAFAILICRGQHSADLDIALEKLIEEGLVMDDEGGHWHPVRPHPEWRLVAVADGPDYKLTEKFPYKVTV